MNNDDKNKVTMNIPGVIIPPQQTENGTVVSSGVQSRVINQQNVNNQVPNNTQSNTTVSSNNTQVVQPNSVNNVTTSNVVPQSNNVVPPSVNNNINQKQKKAKNNGGSNLLTILLLLIFMGTTFYLLYDKFFNKEEVDPVKEYARRKTVNKTSLVVQTLYDYINLDGCYDQISFLYDTKEVVTLSDLTHENKNYLAYLQLKNKHINAKNCASFPDALHSNDVAGLWYCGENNNSDDTNNTTFVINEEELKNQVIKMFGSGSYKNADFQVGNGARYLYLDKNSSYAYQTFYDNTSKCNTYENSLQKVYQQGNNLTLVVRVTNKENKKMRVFSYVFTESDDGAYYFSKLIKKQV